MTNNQHLFLSLLKGILTNAHRLTALVVAAYTRPSSNDRSGYSARNELRRRKRRRRTFIITDDEIPF